VRISRTVSCLARVPAWSCSPLLRHGIGRSLTFLGRRAVTGSFFETRIVPVSRCACLAVVACDLFWHVVQWYWMKRLVDGGAGTGHRLHQESGARWQGSFSASCPKRWVIRAARQAILLLLLVTPLISTCLLTAFDTPLCRGLFHRATSTGNWAVSFFGRRQSLYLAGAVS
jgi:hypothetical protein